MFFEKVEDVQLMGFFCQLFDRELRVVFYYFIGKQFWSIFKDYFQKVFFFDQVMVDCCYWKDFDQVSLVMEEVFGVVFQYCG